MTKRQWKNLLNAIHHGNCILMLGPAVSSREQNHQFTPFSQLFAEELAEELEEEKVDYAKEHRQNLSYISQLYEKINDVSPLDAVYAAKDFYKAQAQQPNSIHQTLAELPFHLILNTTPDDLMFKAMRKAGNFQTHHQHYNFSKNKSKKADFDKDAETNWDEPTKSNPLIYNLFGFYEVPASLVLSQTQQVVFTSAVVSKNPRIPTAISSQFDGSKTYLFLGFDWEEWHLPLLLGSFNLHQQQEGNLFSLSQEKHSLKRITKDFYKNSFKFKFVENDILTFVEELKTRYEDYTWKEGSSNQQKVCILSDFKDKAYRDELGKHLKLWERTNQISLWHEGKIPPSANIRETIEQKISSADLHILLLSANFWNSDELIEHQLPLVLQQQNAKLLTVIIRPCDWEGMVELRQSDEILPVLNGKVGAPISTWQHPEEAYRQIVEGVKKLLDL